MSSLTESFRPLCSQNNEAGLTKGWHILPALASHIRIGEAPSDSAFIPLMTTEKILYLGLMPVS